MLLNNQWNTEKNQWVMVESPDKTWSTGEGNGKPLQDSCLEKSMNSMKRQMLIKFCQENALVTANTFFQ